MNIKKQKFSHWWHTIKYLRFRQVVYRIYYLFFKLSPKTLHALDFDRRQWSSPWSAPGLFDSSLTEDGVITLLGETGFIRTKSDWNDSAKSKLWLYHLHYLQELNVRDADRNTALNQALIERWIKDNPPLSGNGWEPYPLSLRLVSLVKWFSRNEKLVTHEWLINLGLQAQALMGQIEYHILGNHLFANGKALVFAGAFLEGQEADKWLQKGLVILDGEIKEQFLSDGAHFELSPMYHANLLWDLCDLVHLAQISGLAELTQRQQVWRAYIERGLHWLHAMCHPDGAISFFNDAALGMAPEFTELMHYAQALGVTINLPTQDRLLIQQFPDSGYHVVCWDELSKAVIDLAHVGPDYQPGHAHADTLSFELSLFGQRFLVNSGTSQYGNSAERHYERSTIAHNTVCVDAHNSSVVWSGFRVAQRARPKELSVQQQDTVIRITGAHDGYQRLPGCVTHRREWICLPQQLRIEDLLQGHYQEACARFYFHPEVTLTRIEDDLLRCVLVTGQTVLLKILGSAQWVLEETCWRPRFGVQQPNQCLNVAFQENTLTVVITW